jgi:hypothetical protein
LALNSNVDINGKKGWAAGYPKKHLNLSAYIPQQAIWVDCYPPIYPNKRYG